MVVSFVSTIQMVTFYIFLIINKFHEKTKTNNVLVHL